MAKIIVIGNEKGGSGKTTTAMHLICSLLLLGFKVGALDLDSRQQSLARYLDNRAKSKQNGKAQLLMPLYQALESSTDNDRTLADQQDEQQLCQALDELANGNDFIVVDTPGSNTALSRIAHSYADIVITPINDSFVDLDLIGQVDAETLESMKPGIYSAMLWQAKMLRASRTKQEQIWLLVRNRLSTLDAHNKRKMEAALTKLAKRFGFKVIPGFGDRVIFKELFLHGLTLHDAINANEIKLTPSVIAARMELRNFMEGLNIQEVLSRLENQAA